MGQKVNPKGFRIGLNKLWNNEGQCYGKGFKNSRQLLRKTSNISNFFGQHLESVSLIQGHTELKVFNTFWEYNLHYVPMLLRGNVDVDNISKWASAIFKMNIKVNCYNTTFWHQNGILVCEFIKTSLKRGMSFRRVTKIVQQIFATKRNYQISIKTLSGVKLLQFIGLKIRYAGRFGGSRSQMASSIVCKMGTMSLQKIETYVEFQETPLYTKQGVCNLQVWIAYKVIQ